MGYLPSDCQFKARLASFRIWKEVTTVRNADMHGELFYSAVVPPVANLGDTNLREQTYTPPCNVATYNKLESYYKVYVTLKK